MKMDEHHLPCRAMGIEVYFCVPANPWRRGTRENSDGLLRQYHLIGTDLSHVTPKAVRRSEREINIRPRKSLGGQSADGVFRDLRAIVDPHGCDDY
jgi:IS30 family transposase